MGFVKFLGTAGARFVMIRQTRSSGGVWINYGSTNIIIDPGPGAIVRCNKSRPKLDPTRLDGIIITHKHLDHSGDINVMVEAMTEGGFCKRGALFAPSDAFGQNGVIYSYLMDHPERIERIKPGDFDVGGIRFSVVMRNQHSVETYGVKFFLGTQIISFVSDTKYFDGLIEAYADSTVLVLNVVFTEPKKEYEHLSLPEALDIIKKIRPPVAILTHFGMGMLKAGLHKLEKRAREELKMDIRFAYDGMSLEFDS